jgi:cation transporter-like permease
MALGDGSLEQGADATTDERLERDRAAFVLRFVSSIVISVVAGVATFLAGVGGATPIPPRYVAPVALFVTVGLLVAFYVDLTAGRA